MTMTVAPPRQAERLAITTFPDRTSNDRATSSFGGIKNDLQNHYCSAGHRFSGGFAHALCPGIGVTVRCHTDRFRRGGCLCVCLGRQWRRCSGGDNASTQGGNRGSPKDHAGRIPPHCRGQGFLARGYRRPDRSARDACPRRRPHRHRSAGKGRRQRSPPCRRCR